MTDDKKKVALVAPSYLPDGLVHDWQVLADAANGDGEIEIVNPDAVSVNRLEALFAASGATLVNDSAVVNPDGASETRTMVVKVNSDELSKESPSQAAAARPQTFA